MKTTENIDGGRPIGCSGSAIKDKWRKRAISLNSFHRKAAAIVAKVNGDEAAERYVTDAVLRWPNTSRNGDTPQGAL